MIGRRHSLGAGLAGLALLAFAAAAPAPVAAQQGISPVLRAAVVDALTPREQEYVFPGSIIIFQGDFTGDGLRDALAFAYFQPPGGPRGLTVLILHNTGFGYQVVDRPDVFGVNPRNARFSFGRISVVTTMPDGARTWVITPPGFVR